MLVVEGALPLLWTPIWFWLICDSPGGDPRVSARERALIESALANEAEVVKTEEPVSHAKGIWSRQTVVMIAICILYNSAGFGMMTFFTTTLKGRLISPAGYGLLFAVPYVVTPFVMILNSWHSDRTRERRWHVAIVLGAAGACLAASAIFRSEFWLSYVLLCLAIPGPFSALAPFYSIPSETLPRTSLGPVIGLVNSVGCLGGFLGPYFTGKLEDIYHSISIPFGLLGLGMMTAAALVFLLPKSTSLGNTDSAQLTSVPSL